jgi:hypothetical protein
VTAGAFYYSYAATMQEFHFWELLNKRPDSAFVSMDPEEYFSRFKDRCEFVDYNKIVFVPKTAKVHRTIAVEPLLNGYVQKGIDLLMRKRLKRVGIDLADQTRNQELARQGSLETDDPYVTIDLSAASDSCATELCRFMLPLEWYDFLNATRSHRYKLNGKILHYQKFTSMGNGFCFPLETLIFASLCNVAYQEVGLAPDYSVYGDDIIVRKSVADRVLFLLRVCGFKANRDKTFLTGPFRESCGADWFSGEDVRPLTLDYAFDSFQSVAKFCNLVRSKGAWECIFYEATAFLRTLIPRKLFFCRPYKGVDDSAFEVPFDEFMASPHSRFHSDTWSWSWIEAASTSVADVSVTRFAGYDVAFNRGMLAGGVTPNPFTIRRKTSTKIRRITHFGLSEDLDQVHNWSRSQFLPKWLTDSLPPVFQWVRALR